MKRDANGPTLSAIFVDYDNIYMSLKRKNEDAAKRFSKDAALWIRELENGALITATSGYSTAGARRIVMNRCYGNPVPRRNSHDNSTDMSSFPFIRHHFLRAGAEVIDCPPLTAQLKNSADIRIVMDVRDMITHDTYFDEFIILSSDADFTPLLHRLRAHARRTVIYANDQTASPYTAISDGEVRESDLLRLLLDTRGTDRAITADAPPAQLPQPGAEHSLLRRDLANEAANLVRAAGQPVPLEALADRLVRQFGHDRTSGSNWAGMGGFRDLMASYLPDGIKISDQPPFVVFDTTPAEATQRYDAQTLSPRGPAPFASEPASPTMPPVRQPRMAPDAQRLAQLPAVPGQPRTIGQPIQQGQSQLPPQRGSQAPTVQHPPSTYAPGSQPVTQPHTTQQHAAPHQYVAHHPIPQQLPTGLQAPTSHQPQAQLQAPAQIQPPQRPQPMSTAAVQQMVARIYEACQAPGISPPEYRLVFDIMAQEISARGLAGMQTLESIGNQAKGFGIKLSRDDVRFILEVVSEGDEWFENGISANVFAKRFRNFVIARCRSNGLTLSAEEIDLVDTWFAVGDQSIAQAAPVRAQLPAPPTQAAQSAPQHAVPLLTANPVDIWWSTDAASGQRATGTDHGDDFPRIIRSRTRG